MTPIQRAIAIALALPPALALVLVLAIAAAERAGWTFLHDVRPANLAEAAAVGRGDEVIRRLRRGEPLREVYPLRPEATHSPLVRASPAEAAIWSRQLLMVELLDREGGIASAERADLACLARDLDVSEIADYLSPATADTCEPQRARARVLARRDAP